MKASRVIIALMFVAAVLAREQTHKRVETHKAALKARLSKKKCDGELEDLQKEVEAVRTEQNNAKVTVTELQNAIPTVKTELTNKMDELQSKLDTLSTQINAKVAEISSKVESGCTACKEETKKMIDELKGQVGQNKDNISKLDNPFSKEMTKNIMQNGKVEGCFNLQGVRQPLESWKYQSAIVPTSNVDDPNSYSSQDGGNGGWSVISTRLGNNAVGVGIIDLQAEYYVKKFVFWSWGTYMNAVELFQWVPQTAPDFNSPATITNEANWKSMGKLENLPAGPSPQTTYTVPHNMDCEFKGRWIKTHSHASNIQVIAGLKGFGEKA